MSVRALAWALHDARPRELDAVERLILVALADYANTDGIAWPSRHKLADVAGVSVDTVDRRVRNLLAYGLIRLADPADCPAAWHQLPANRRPMAYRLHEQDLGPQPAASQQALGPQHAESWGRNTPSPGAAAVRHKPRTEPRTEPARAREAGQDTRGGRPAPLTDFDRRPESTRPCTVCRRIHPPGTPHPRRDPAAAAAGIAAARAALTRKERPA